LAISVTCLILFSIGTLVLRFIITQFSLLEDEDNEFVLDVDWLEWEEQIDNNRAQPRSDEVVVSVGGEMPYHAQ